MANAIAPQALPGQRTGEFENVKLLCVGEGIVWDSAACFAEQRKALCFALQVFILYSGLHYGETRRWMVVLLLH